MHEGGGASETVTVEIGGQTITVANNLSPMWLEATPTSLQWLVNELYTDMLAFHSGSSASSGADEHVGGDLHVVCADDSDDDDPECMVLINEIESIKKSKDRVYECDRLANSPMLQAFDIILGLCVQRQCIVR